MVAVSIKLKLTDSCAREAKANQLLTAEAIEALLRDEIRRRKVGKLFDAADRLSAIGEMPLAAEEVEAEVMAVRATRRATGARRR